VVNMLIGGGVKVIVNYFLVGLPQVNILGAAIGTLCCYGTITVLNLFALGRLEGDHKLRFSAVMLKPLAAAAIMGVGAFLACRGLTALTVSSKIACLGGVAVGAAVYAVLVVVLKVITYDDCMLLPKGEKIAKILRIR